MLRRTYPFVPMQEYLAALEAEPNSVPLTHDEVFSVDVAEADLAYTMDSRGKTFFDLERKDVFGFVFFAKHGSSACLPPLARGTGGRVRSWSVLEMHVVLASGHAL